MLGNKYYLTKGLNDWIVDSGMTPYLLVNAAPDGVNVPEQFVKDGKIVLNAHPNAVKDLRIQYHAITFSATFGGEEWHLSIPMPALMAIYAMENGRGMQFSDENDADVGDETPPPSGAGSDDKPTLKLVE
jgi:stringent starvation protein B